MWDVIIVGAGPTGLVCGLYLAKAGFSALVLEADSGISKNLRGSTFHPSSLDMLETAFGAATPLIERGLIAPSVQYRRHGEGKIAEFKFCDIAHLTNHPYRVQAEQYKLSEILWGMLSENAMAEVRFSTEVVDLDQSENNVTVYTASGEKFECAYLIGADGANSIVRRRLDIPFEGFTWPERFLVVSTPFDFFSVFPDLSSVSYVADEKEWYFLLQIPDGLWRCMFPTRPNEEDEAILADDRVQARMARIHNCASHCKVAHKTLYKVHQRVARTYRVDRIMLAGDAAHINNPLGGMGMNGGIHDSFNLSEKLVDVLKGQAEPLLLDRYDAERRGVALEYVQRVSIQNKKDLESDDPNDQAVFRARLKDAEKDIHKRRDLLMRLSMYASLGKTA